MLVAVYSPGSYGTSSPEGARNMAMLGILLALLLTGLLGHQSIEFSSDNRSYRTCFALLGLRLGRWQPLPQVVGVTLKFFSEVARGNSGNGTTSWGIWDTSGRQYQKLVLLLSLQNSTTGLVIGEFKPTALAEAREEAQALAARFGVEVREYLAPQRTRRR